MCGVRQQIRLLLLQPVCLRFPFKIVHDIANTEQPKEQSPEPRQLPPQCGTPLVGPDDRRAQGLKIVIQIDDRRPLRRHDHCRYLGGLNTLCPQTLATRDQ